jgi:hypothetical protein
MPKKPSMARRCWSEGIRSMTGGAGAIIASFPYLQYIR